MEPRYSELVEHTHAFRGMPGQELRGRQENGTITALFAPVRNEATILLAIFGVLE
jgi:hypothetical protein